MVRLGLLDPQRICVHYPPFQVAPGQPAMIVVLYAHPQWTLRVLYGWSTPSMMLSHYGADIPLACISLSRGSKTEGLDMGLESDVQEGDCLLRRD
jgi:hypothetical protein